MTAGTAEQFATFAEAGIHVPAGTGGNVSMPCPSCGPTRKNKNARSLSVNVDKGVWNCKNCGWSGGLTADRLPPQNRGQNRKAYTRPKPVDGELTPKAEDWFKGRGISRAVLDRNQVGVVNGQITFPYFRDGELVNVKYRTPDKSFRMEKDAELILYGLDDIKGQAVVLICEGECDKLALEEAGYTNAVSVPNGAPNENERNVEKRFEPVATAAAWLDPAKQIILAGDNDGPGKRLEDELARRLGKHRCYRVTWPDGCKDANDVLVNCGPFALEQCIKEAKPWPISGLITVDDIAGDAARLIENGVPRGALTGWLALDDIFTLGTGRLTIVTGIPGSGKSEFIEALVVNLAQIHGWPAALYSPEHHPQSLHFLRFATKWQGQSVEYFNGFEKLTAEGIAQAQADMAKLLFWIAPPDTERTLDDILERATAQVSRYGVRVLVIDPWNELEASRPAGQTEAEFLSRTLSRLKKWAQRYDVHVFVVAHPKVLLKKGATYAPPTPYEISGGAHWYNKADNCLCVHRYQGPKIERAEEVTIYVQKVKWRNEGEIGSVVLLYERATGRYREPGT